MPMDAAVMAKGIEIVFHVVAFLLAIGVVAMICIQAQSFGRSNQTLLTAPSSLQAGYIGLLILYMIYHVFKNQGFRVANADVESVEVVVILLMILIYFKLTVFKDINTTNLAALTIIDGVQSMNTSTAHDLHVHRRQPHESAYVATTDPQGLKGAFSLSFWIGIDPATLTGVYGALAAYATNTSKAGPQLLSEDKKSYRVKVPIFIRGIPKYWLVANGLNPELYDDSAVALVKCPIIWLVIGVDATTTTPLAPFFEVEFNHMDIPSDVLIVPNTCYVQDTFTAKCTFFENSLDMDVHDQLKQGNPLDANAMHLVTFVFQEDYVNSSISSMKKDQYTKASIYIDGSSSKQESYFKGQMRLSSSKVMALPSELLDYQLQADSATALKVAAFLAKSRIVMLPAADVDSLKSIGLDAPVVSASSKQLNAAQKMPDNTDRALTTLSRF